MGFRDGFFVGYQLQTTCVYIRTKLSVNFIHTLQIIFELEKTISWLTNFFTQINHLDCQKSYFSSKPLWKSVFGSQFAIRQCNGGVSRALDYLIMANTDKRTDVWFRPSCIYTQIFSPKKNWFFPHKKCFPIFFWFLFTFILCNFLVRTLKYFQKNFKLIFCP